MEPDSRLKTIGNWFCGLSILGLTCQVINNIMFLKELKYIKAKTRINPVLADYDVKIISEKKKKRIKLNKDQIVWNSETLDKIEIDEHLNNIEILSQNISQAFFSKKEFVLLHGPIDSDYGDFFTYDKEFGYVIKTFCLRRIVKKEQWVDYKGTGVYLKSWEKHPSISSSFPKRIRNEQPWYLWSSDFYMRKVKINGFFIDPIELIKVTKFSKCDLEDEITKQKSPYSLIKKKYTEQEIENNSELGSLTKCIENKYIRRLFNYHIEKSKIKTGFIEIRSKNIGNYKISYKYAALNQKYTVFGIRNYKTIIPYFNFYALQGEKSLDEILKMVDKSPNITFLSAMLSLLSCGLILKYTN